MISFLENWLLVSFDCVIGVSAIGLIVMLCVDKLRSGLLSGFAGAFVGTFIGLLVGKESSDPMFWPIVMIACGVTGAATGFLIFAGIYFVAPSRNLLLGTVFLISGLSLPAAGASCLYIRPKLIAHEWAWWDKVLKNGASPGMTEEARKYLSQQTKKSLEHHVEVAKPNSIPPSTVILLNACGINVADYVPIPPEVAWQAIGTGGHYNIGLAKNPSTPTEILDRMSHSDDWHFLRMLCHNPALPETTSRQLAARLETALAAENNKPADIRYRGTTEEILAGLQNLAANPRTPGDVLEVFSRKDDLGLLNSLAANPVLPEELGVVLRGKYLEVLSQPESEAQRIGPDKESAPHRLAHAGLEALAANPHMSSLLEQLSNSDDLVVLQNLVGNPSLSTRAANSLMLQYLALLPLHPLKQQGAYDDSRDKIEDGMRKLAMQGPLSNEVLQRTIEVNDLELLKIIAAKQKLPANLRTLLRRKFNAAIAELAAKEFRSFLEDRALSTAELGLAALDAQQN